MPLSKAIKLKLDTRKEEYEYNQDTLNAKLSFAAKVYYQGLPELGMHTTTHAKVFLVFRDLLEMLDAVKNDYPKYEINQTYTRSKDGTWRVCLDKPPCIQDKELSVIEGNIKRSYKESLVQIKETVISEILEEVAAEKFALEEQKRLDKLDKEHNDLKQALFNAA